MPVPPPEVDYADTSLRPTWDRLPGSVRGAVARLAGAAVVMADPPVRSGFTGSYAGVVTSAFGRRLFVKASGPELAHSFEALTRESAVLAELPEGIPAPSLVGSDVVDGWCVLALEVVDGRMPGQPWTIADVDAVHDACLLIAELGTPTVPPARQLGDRDYAARIADDPAIVGLARRLVDGSYEVTAELPGWLARRGADVGDLVLSAPGRFDGRTISHGDLRPDNLLVTTSGRAVVLDWNWVGRAAPWLDWVGLLPMMAWQGVDVATLMDRSPLTRGVDPDAVDSFLACIAAYMLEGYVKAPPAGCIPVLRRHQLLMAHMFLGLLRSRRGWAEG